MKNLIKIEYEITTSQSIVNLLTTARQRNTCFPSLIHVEGPFSFTASYQVSYQYDTGATGKLLHVRIAGKLCTAAMRQQTW